MASVLLPIAGAALLLALPVALLLQVALYFLAAKAPHADPVSPVRPLPRRRLAA